MLKFQSLHTYNLESGVQVFNVSMEKSELRKLFPRMVVEIDGEKYEVREIVKMKTSEKYSITTVGLKVQKI